MSVISGLSMTWWMNKVEKAPVHRWMLQSFCCSAAPRQPLPPLWGDGLLHWRLLNCTPRPQGSEQSPQAAHWLQPPSTLHPGTDSHCRTPASQELNKRVKTAFNLMGHLLWQARDYSDQVSKWQFIAGTFMMCWCENCWIVNDNLWKHLNFFYEWKIS